MLGSTLILLAFVGLVIFVVGGLANVGALNGKSIEERDWEGSVQAWNVTLAGDALAELQSGSFQQITTSAIERRSTRIRTILQPASSGTRAGINISNLSIGALTTDPWNKANGLSIAPALGLLHPCGRSPALSFQQTISSTMILSDFVGPRLVSSNLVYHAFAASDIGLVIQEAYTGASGPSFAVHGTAFLAGGFTAASGTTRLSADIIASPSGTLGSGVTGKTIAGTAVAVHPFYRITLGTAATELCRPVNQSGSLTSQSFFDRSTSIVNVVGMSASSLPAGVSITEYPVGSGVTRVVVDLAILGATSAKVYVNLIQSADQAVGVAILGSASAPSGQHVVVATNGLVRLEGNNALPCVIASSFGQVFCEDLTGNAALSQTWVGSLFMPAATAYTATQVGSGAVFRLRGALFTGQPSGNLPLIDITEIRSPEIRDDGPRLVTLGSVR